ncbi:MAG TPA: hypothetical protein VF323_10285, partial [Candidatus Limnocylindrales bacterium]
SGDGLGEALGLGDGPAAVAVGAAVGDGLGVAAAPQAATMAPIAPGATPMARRRVTKARRVSLPATYESASSCVRR